MNGIDDNEGERQILTNFRLVAKSFADMFRYQRNHVHNLLAGAHNYTSGTFREGLIRSFLSSVLPKSVSVDSGFVYGFDRVTASKQIDVLVWDSGRHAAVFRTGEFVIVPPESVIAALSVKSSLTKGDIEDALANLLSLTPLESAYRSAVDEDTGMPLIRPIVKIVVGYTGWTDHSAALRTVGTFFEKTFASNASLAGEIVEAFRDFNPTRPQLKNMAQAERVFPKLIAAIEANEVSLYQGWGPPEDLTGTGTYGPGLRRLPYMYLQDKKLTSPLEKVVYQVLRATYMMLGTQGHALVAAWGEIDPITGYRVGDADEIVHNQSTRLVDPDHLGEVPVTCDV